MSLVALTNCNTKEKFDFMKLKINSNILDVNKFLSLGIVKSTLHV